MEGSISTVQFSPWVINYLTFGIDIIEGTNNWRSCSCALISFLKNLKKSTTDRTLALKLLDLDWREVCHLLWILR